MKPNLNIPTPSRVKCSGGGVRLGVCVFKFMAWSHQRVLLCPNSLPTPYLVLHELLVLQLILLR